MLKQLKKWCKELCSETVNTAETICDKTKKANANLVKAIMENI